MSFLRRLSMYMQNPTRQNISERMPAEMSQLITVDILRQEDSY